MIRKLYSYNADTQHAKVYHRTTGAVVCEVEGVNLYVGNLLSRLAEEMYNDGYDKGRVDVLDELTTHLERMSRR